MNDNPYAASNTDVKDSFAETGSGSKKRTIKSFEPVQLGKMLGILYVIMSLLIVPFMLIAALFGGTKEGGLAFVFMVLFIPIIYGAIGFVTGLVGGFVYNLCAKIVGGIEVEIA